MIIILKGKKKTGKGGWRGRRGYIRDGGGWEEENGRGVKGMGREKERKGGVVAPRTPHPYSKPCIDLPLNEVRNGSNSGYSAFLPRPL